MSDAADKRLTPDAKEKLASALRQKLARKRINKTPFVVVGSILLVAALVGLWFAFEHPEPLPRVMLVVYDALESDGTVKAQLVAPGEPNAKLEGLELDWKMKDAAHDEEATTKTDVAGIAYYKIGSGDKRKARTLIHAINPTIQVLYAERPLGVNRREKTIRLTSHESFGNPILIVPLETFAVDGKAVDWSERESSRLPKPPSRTTLGIKDCKSGLPDAKCEVIYTSGDVGWETYQRMRNWLDHYKNDNDADVALGPLLNERAEAAEERLSGRMGANKVRRWRQKEK